MQSDGRVLARRYARALFNSAAEAGAEEAAGMELAKAARVLSEGMAEFNHPRIAVGEKKKRLAAEVANSVSARTLRFLELLIEKKRFALVGLMAADYGRLHDEARGIVHAAVRAAAEPSPDELKSLKDRLGALSGKKVVLDVKIQPELLAGVVVRMGDWVFDASLTGELGRLSGRLAAQSLSGADTSAVTGS